MARRLKKWEAVATVGTSGTPRSNSATAGGQCCCGRRGGECTCTMSSHYCNDTVAAAAAAAIYAYQDMWPSLDDNNKSYTITASKHTTAPTTNTRRTNNTTDSTTTRTDSTNSCINGANNICNSITTIGSNSGGGDGAHAGSDRRSLLLNYDSYYCGSSSTSAAMGSGERRSFASQLNTTRETGATNEMLMANIHAESNKMLCCSDGTATDNDFLKYEELCGDELVVCPICCCCYGYEGRSRQETKCCRRHLCLKCAETVLKQKVELRYLHEENSSARACPFCRNAAACSRTFVERINGKNINGMSNDACGSRGCVAELELAVACCSDFNPEIDAKIKEYMSYKHTKA
eukprot:Lankesteria_metandrocarpae@DN136_c0_g1_i1.p1